MINFSLVRHLKSPKKQFSHQLSVFMLSFSLPKNLVSKAFKKSQETSSFEWFIDAFKHRILKSKQFHTRYLFLLMRNIISDCTYCTRRKSKFTCQEKFLGLIVKILDWGKNKFRRIKCFWVIATLIIFEIPEFWWD